jgi:hypothetical protein
MLTSVDQASLLTDDADRPLEEQAEDQQGEYRHELPLHIQEFSKLTQSEFGDQQTVHHPRACSFFFPVMITMTLTVFFSRLM